MRPSFGGALLFLVLVTSPARASDKIDVGAGLYSISSKGGSKTGSASGLGVYRATYYHRVLPSLDLGIGYTLVMSGVIGGDMGYGPDLAAAYYPLTDAASYRAKTETVSTDFGDQFRPFVSAGFHQRNFQSVDSGYAGFSLGTGSEYEFRPNLSFKAEVRYQMLSGQKSITATQIDAVAGVVFKL